MESDEEFFDAEEYEEEKVAPDYKNIDPSPSINLVAKTLSISSTSGSIVHYKNKKYSEFLHISVYYEIELPFKSSSWIIQFSLDGSQVAIAGNHGTILLYPLTCKQILGPPLFLSEHTYDITSLSWSSQQTLLSSSIDHTIKEWGISIQSLNTFQYHCKIVSCVYLPQDNNFFIAAFEDFVIRTVYIPNRQIVNSVQLFENILCMAVAQTGNVLAVGMDKGKVIPFRIRESDFKLIDRPILNSKNRGGFKKSGKQVTGLYFATEDELIVTTLDSNVRLFNLQDYQMKQKYKGALMKTKLFCAQVSEDKKFVICGSEKGKFLLWNFLLTGESKNKKYESVKLRKRKMQEFSTFAPKGSLEILKQPNMDFAFSYLIFSIDGVNSLKVLLC